MDEFKSKQMFKRAAPSAAGAATVIQPKTPAKGTESYQSVFAPTNLDGQVDSSEADEEQAKGTENYQDIFAPPKKQADAE